MKWNRNQIAIASVLSSVANLGIVVLLARRIDGSVAALWLFSRAACQLAMVLVPSPIGSMMMLMNTSDGLDKKNEVAIRSESAILSAVAVVATLSAVAVILFGTYFSPRSNISLVVAMAFYCLPFCAASVLSGIPRVRMRSDLILNAAKIEAVFGIVAMGSIFLGFFAFLGVAMLQLLVRAKIYADLVEAPQKFGFPISDIFNSGAPIYTRNISQVIGQYGDRLAAPLIFGASLAGHMGVGSSVAAVTSIFSSSAAAYSLPRFLRGEPESSAWMVEAWTDAILLAGAVPVIAYYGLHLLGYVDNGEAIAVGAYLAGVMATTFLSTVRSRMVLASSLQPFHNLLLTAAIYLLLAAFLGTGLSMAKSVCAALLVVPCYFLVSRFWSAEPIPVRVPFAYFVAGALFAIAMRVGYSDEYPLPQIVVLFAAIGLLAIVAKRIVFTRRSDSA